MTGENVHFGAVDAAGRTPAKDAPVALDVRNLGGEDFSDISFTVRRGEVLGISGAGSSGRIGVAEAVAGLGALRQGFDQDQ